MSRLFLLFGLFSLSACCSPSPSASAPPVSNDWRSLPLIEGDKPHPAWQHTGHGSFSVHDGVLRTDCSPQGLGLLVYTAEQFGDCQIRVVYKSDPPRSNAGVYIRIDNGILAQLGVEPPPVKRDAGGGLAEDQAKIMMEASEKELGPWYAVHHGFEVQICDGADPWHRTGAIYSLAKAEPLPAGSTARDAYHFRDESPVQGGAWRTMTITLRGDLVSVDVGGVPTTSFDSAAKDLPARRAWHEPKREPTRPRKGYIGLQNHDPGDVVYFKEVSVRQLPAK